MPYLIDTNIIIDHLRGDSQATALLQKAEDGLVQAFISVITEYELLASSKLSLQEEKKIADLISRILPSLAITSYVAKTAASFHRKYATDFADALIAATAYNTRATLVTRNIRHFKAIKEIHTTSIPVEVSGTKT